MRRPRAAAAGRERADWLRVHARRKKPPTWPHDEEILARLLAAEAESAQEGLPRPGAGRWPQFRWLFGIEVELVVKVAPAVAEDARILREERRLAAELLRDERATADRERREQIDAQLRELPRYRLRDLVLFQLHEALRGHIEHRYSNTSHAVGYYDTPVMAELRTVPGDARRTIERLHRILAAFVDVERRSAEKWGRGSVRCDERGTHINASPNVVLPGGELRSLARMSDDAGLEFMRHALTGIAAVLLDGLLLNSSFATQISQFDGDTFSIGTSRADLIRLCRDRFEWREGGRQCHAALQLLLLVKGAEYGLLHSLPSLASAGYTVPEPVTVGLFGNPPGTHLNPCGDGFFSKRVMQGGYLDEDGFLHPNERYCAHFFRGLRLVSELTNPHLRIIPERAVVPDRVRQIFDKRTLVALFSRVRVTKDGIDLRRVEAELDRVLGGTRWLTPKRRAHLLAMMRAVWLEGFARSLRTEPEKFCFGAASIPHYVARYRRSPALRHVLGDGASGGSLFERMMSIVEPSAPRDQPPK